MLHYIALLYFLFIAMMHFCICRELRNHTSVHFSQHVCSIKAASRLNNSGMESSCLHLKVDALVDSAHPQWSTVMPTIMLWKHYQYAIDVSFHPRVPLIITSLCFWRISKYPSAPSVVSSEYSGKRGSVLHCITSFCSKHRPPLHAVPSKTFGTLSWSIYIQLQCTRMQPLFKRY